MSNLPHEPDTQPPKQINCLRCRHCHMAKAPAETLLARAVRPDGSAETDAIIVIYCAKLKRNRPAFIHADCPFADARIHSSGYYDHRLRRHSDRCPDGDKSVFVTPLERLFLQAHYYAAPESLLERTTLRPWKQIRKAARRYGVTRDPALVLEQIRKGTAAARSQVKSPRFNQTQREYIGQCFASGFWPARTCPQAMAKREHYARIKAEIVAGVAARGEVFSWGSIAAHAHEMQPGAQRWRKRWDATRRRKGVFVQKNSR